MKKVAMILAIMIVLFASTLVGKLSLDTLNFQIWSQLRIPRVLLGFFAGGILALSGLLFQTLFRNPLTTPFTLGISSGATLGASIAIMIGLHGAILGFSWISLFGFLGALSTVMMIYLFSRKLSHSSDQRLILVGIALSFLYTAVLMILYYISDFQESYEMMRFTMGSLLTVGYMDIVPIMIAAGIILYLSLYYKEALKLLSISDDFAYLKGLDVSRTLVTLFVVISLAVGVLVSITGPISFVGLIIPHMIKRIWKKSVEHLLLPSFVAGGIFLLLCDTLSRALPTVSELPVGVITSIIGGSLFVWILLKGGRG